MADDKQERIETLQDRVDELEATVSKMLPSRRDALKLGAAGAVGAVGMAGSASAQNSGQTGTIGTDADRVDVNAEDIDAVSVNTDQSLVTPEVDRVARLSAGGINNIDLTAAAGIRPGDKIHVQVVPETEPAGDFEIDYALRWVDADDALYVIITEQRGNVGADVRTLVWIKA